MSVTLTSPESERAILGACLLDPTVWPMVSSRLSASAFSEAPNRLIFGAVATLHLEGTVPDLRTVQALLELRGEFERAGGVAYLSMLDLDLPDLGRLESYVEIVADRSARRHLASIGDDLRREAQAAESAIEVASRLIVRAQAVLESSAPSSLVAFSEAIAPTMEAIEEGRREALLGLSTGFEEVDALTAGFKPGQLIIIGGRPGHGKTSLGMNIVEHVVLDRGGAALVCTLEMSPEELAFRLLCTRAGIPAGRYQSGATSTAQWDRHAKVTKALGLAPLLFDGDVRTPSHVESAALRARHQLGRLDLVMVDYLQLMTDDDRHGRRDLEIAAISRRMKLLAKRLGIPVLLLSQLSREPTRRADPRPQLSDLRESGAIEQDADIVAFVHRESEYKPDEYDLKGRGELILAKVRGGQTGIVPVAWCGELTRYSPLAQPAAPAYPSEDPF